MQTRGYFGIGIYGPKTAVNVGTLWRSAAAMGAAFIFTIGRRYQKQASDTIKAWRHVPLWEYRSIDDLAIPRDCILVGVEQTDRGRYLPDYTHPDRAMYLLGAEDGGLPERVMDRCHHIVSIPSVRCLNVAVAGSIVLYDREAKAPGG